MTVMTIQTTSVKRLLRFILATWNRPEDMSGRQLVCEQEILYFLLRVCLGVITLRREKVALAYEHLLLVYASRARICSKSCPSKAITDSVLLSWHGMNKRH
jgi:hypothetical protein